MKVGYVKTLNTERCDAHQDQTNRLRIEPAVSGSGDGRTLPDRSPDPGQQPRDAVAEVSSTLTVCLFN